jgi:hypothetical protein
MVSGCDWASLLPAAAGMQSRPQLEHRTAAAVLQYASPGCAKYLSCLSSPASGTQSYDSGVFSHANHLQEYVESLEATAAEQRKQLGRLKEEKRAQEKVRQGRQLQLGLLETALSAL